jgi:hypothetical protein
MARRFGWASCAMGLHVCILAGCLHTDTKPLAQGETQSPPVAGLEGVSGTSSPYGLRLTPVRFSDHKAPPAAQPDPPPASEITRTSQPDADKAASTDDPPVPQSPQPLSPSPLPPTEQIASQTVSAQTIKEAPEPPLVTALRLVLGKKAPEAFDALQGYDKPTQEILYALLPLEARLGEGGLDEASPQEMAALIEQLNQVSNLLRGRAALTLERACFARRIDGFGVYDPLASNPVFTAGADGQHGDRAQVYAEVRNFLSKYDGKVHEIRLTGRLEIYGSDGQCRWAKNYRDDATWSLSPRQDFFVSFKFYPPRDLRPGNYILVVEVRDETIATPEAHPRVARCRLPFRIGDPTPSYRGRP